MKKLNLSIQKYLLWALPFVVTTMIWNFFQTDFEIRAMGSQPIKILWEIMSWNLMIWFFILFIFMLLLVFRKDTQEQTIKHLAGIKERDEREQVIMGIAARRSFVTTTAFLIFLFFLSCVTLNVSRLAEQTVDGKKASLSLGFNFSGIDKTKTTSEDGKTIFEHHDIPLSKSALILLVLIWQISAFRFRVQKELKEV